MNNKKNYDYLQDRIKNTIDLSGVNDYVKIVAEKVFNKSDDQLVGIMIDEKMEIEDLFCFLLELTLTGIKMLDDNIDIFELDSVVNPLIFIIKRKIKKMGIEFIIEELYDTKLDDIDLNFLILPFNDKVSLINGKKWILMNKYIIVEKNNGDNSDLSKISAVLKTNNDGLYRIKFNLLNRPLI